MEALVGASLPLILREEKARVGDLGPSRGELSALAAALLDGLLEDGVVRVPSVDVVEHLIPFVRSQRVADRSLPLNGAGPF